MARIAAFAPSARCLNLLADPHRRWPQPGDGAAGLERMVAAVRRALDIADEPYHARDPLLQVIEQRAREQRWHDRGLV